MTTPAFLERMRSDLRKTPSSDEQPSKGEHVVNLREQVALKPTPPVEKRQPDSEGVKEQQRCRKGLAAGDLWAGKYEIGTAKPEDMQQQLMALQNNPNALRALRDAMLLEGKVTKSDEVQ